MFKDESDLKNQKQMPNPIWWTKMEEIVQYLLIKAWKSDIPNVVSKITA